MITKPLAIVSHCRHKPAAWGTQQSSTWRNEAAASSGSASRAFPWDDISQTANCPNDPRVVLLGFCHWKNFCCFSLGPAFPVLSPYGAFLFLLSYFSAMICMNLRIFRGTRYYRDSGKRVRDETNRRRGGQKRLGNVTLL